MEQVSTAHSREKFKRWIIGRYHTVSAGTEEEVEPEGEVEKVFFLCRTKKEPKKSVCFFGSGAAAVPMSLEQIGLWLDDLES